VLDRYTNNQESSKEIIHAHGFKASNSTDGVPGISGVVLDPADESRVTFELDEENRRAGEYWLHSHWHEPYGMSLPIIIESDTRSGDLNTRHGDDAVIQDSVLYLEDFCPYFADDGPDSNPTCSHTAVQDAISEAYYGKHGEPVYPSYEDPEGNENNCDNAPVDAANSGDVNFQAILANRRTFDDPHNVAVKEATTHLRVRVYNAATQSNFHVNFGGLPAKLVAVDGQWVEEIDVTESGWWVAVSQRLQVIVDVRGLKHGEGDWSKITARNEDIETSQQAGLIVTRDRGADASHPQAKIADSPANYMTNDGEKMLKAFVPLADPHKDPDVQ